MHAQRHLRPYIEAMFKHNHCYSWGGAMGHRPIQKKNGPLTTEIAILNLERMANWNFRFIGNKWKMAHTIVCPAITLHNYNDVANNHDNGNVFSRNMASFRLLIKLMPWLLAWQQNCNISGCNNNVNRGIKEAKSIIDERFGQFSSWGFYQGGN